MKGNVTVTIATSIFLAVNFGKSERVDRTLRKDGTV